MIHAEVPFDALMLVATMLAATIGMIALIHTAVAHGRKPSPMPARRHTRIQRSHPERS